MCGEDVKRNSGEPGANTGVFDFQLDFMPKISGEGVEKHGKTLGTKGAAISWKRLRLRGLREDRQDLREKWKMLPVFSRKDLPTGKSFPPFLPLISSRLRLARFMLCIFSP